jgi:hypothetical protein
MAQVYVAHLRALYAIDQLQGSLPCWHLIGPGVTLEVARVLCFESWFRIGENNKLVSESWSDLAQPPNLDGVGWAATQVPTIDSGKGH